jgi:hypothetical protein
MVLLDGDARTRARSHTTVRVHFGILRRLTIAGHRQPLCELTYNLWWEQQFPLALGWLLAPS